jgi:predicted RNase H-like HicB family nuclease
MSHVHEDVLNAARRMASGSDWTFAVEAIVRALPHRNPSTVRTHVVSRCCVNAPKNHLHKWPYFRRVGRGLYKIEPKYRSSSKNSQKGSAKDERRSAISERQSYSRKSLHALIQRDEEAYVVECLELPIVSQGATLDEAVSNFREALALHLEGEDLSRFGLTANPDLQIIYEVPAA